MGVPKYSLKYITTFYMIKNSVCFKIQGYKVLLKQYTLDEILITQRFIYRM